VTQNAGSEAYRCAVEDSSTTFDDGPLHIDFERREVTVNSASIDLSAGEYEVLSTLARHRSELLSYDQIANLTWDHSGETVPTMSKYSLLRLSSKLGLEGGPFEPFEHISGVGYMYQSLDATDN
jgi:two-component system copper resistance phosphate regulon response regulator CusR